MGVAKFWWEVLSALFRGGRRGENLIVAGGEREESE